MNDFDLKDSMNIYQKLGDEFSVECCSMLVPNLDRGSEYAQPVINLEGSSDRYQCRQLKNNQESGTIVPDSSISLRESTDSHLMDAKINNFAELQPYDEISEYFYQIGDEYPLHWEDNHVRSADEFVSNHMTADVNPMQRINENIRLGSEIRYRGVPNPRYDPEIGSKYSGGVFCQEYGNFEEPYSFKLPEEKQFRQSKENYANAQYLGPKYRSQSFITTPEGNTSNTLAEGAKHNMLMVHRFGERHKGPIVRRHAAKGRIYNKLKDELRKKIDEIFYARLEYDDPYLTKEEVEYFSETYKCDKKYIWKYLSNKRQNRKKKLTKMNMDSFSG